MQFMRDARIAKINDEDAKGERGTGKVGNILGTGRDARPAEWLEGEEE